jgi:uncharacterized protein (TIGR00730 family)
MTSVCVFCGSSDSVHPEYFSAARRMGQILAERGLGLIYGGGKTGLMGALADGAIQAGGEVIGVIVPSMNTPALAHEGLTRMDVSINMHHRKARMHELADAYIALPGGLGTFDELFETLTWSQTGEHEKPVGVEHPRHAPAAERFCGRRRPMRPTPPVCAQSIRRLLDVQIMSIRMMRSSAG